MSNQFILRLDSHMLSDFQRCKELGNLAHIQGWKTQEVKQGMTRGTRWHRLMEFRAEFKNKRISWNEVITQSIGYLAADGVSMEEIAFFIGKLSQYQVKWEEEENNYEFIDNEVGFSKILYENDEVLFIYEGKIDALLKISGKLTVGDHKTQHPGFSSHRYDLPGYSNQFMGYCWAAKTSNVMIDYTSWSDPKNKISDRTFRREFHPLDPQLIKRWKESTIRSYWDTLIAIRSNEFHLEFPHRCDSRYGMCEFFNVCQYIDPRSKLITLNSNFKQEPRWEPWTHGEKDAEL